MCARPFARLILQPGIGGHYPVTRGTDQSCGSCLQVPRRARLSVQAGLGTLLDLGRSRRSR